MSTFCPLKYTCMSRNLKTLHHSKLCYLVHLCSLRVIHLYGRRICYFFNCCCWSLFSIGIQHCINSIKRVVLVQSGQHRHHLTEILLVVVLKQMKNCCVGAKQQSLTQYFNFLYNSIQFNSIFYQRLTICILK